MLQRPAIIDELHLILSEWVGELSLPKPIGAYLFGSTVNENGVRFQPDSGDLDVILVLDWDAVPPGERVEQIDALRKAKEELEGRLFRKLQRERGSEQIVSLVPVTPFEIEHAVHKDGVKHILTGAKAYDLLEKAEIQSLNGGRALPPLTDAHRTTLNFVQKRRAEALSVAPNGSGGLAIKSHDSDPVPKELMRHFAVATAEPEKHPDISDIARGLNEISSFAREAADWTPMTSAFARWLQVRQGARGQVVPVITADHYLLLVEAIFDRVRAQYSSDAAVQFAGQLAVSAPSLPSHHRLASTFRVTTADKLGGSKADVIRAIRAARANMKARADHPFELLFDEAAEAAELLQADDACLDEDAHRRKVKAFERRTLVAARQQRWTQGVELILWYGGTLFSGGEPVIEAASRKAISNWFAVAATNLVNPGGMFEAAHREFYETYGLALSFSADTSGLKLFGTIKPLTSLKPMDLAGSFVPNLVSKYLHRISQPEHASLKEKQDRVFDVNEWEFGVK